MKSNFFSGSNQHSATAVAHANIALIKYWGKRSEALNLPAAGSISLTLDALKTVTSVHFDETLQEDCFELNGNPLSGKPLTKVTDFLNIACGSNRRPGATVQSSNNFPTGAGLASSASGFAALALAATKAAGRERSKQELSKLARQGSGSAARSLFGGFVEMNCGKTSSGKEDYAMGLFDENYWDVRMLVAVTSTKKKSISSTEGMVHTAETSPFYESWIQDQSYSIDEMRSAIQEKDFEKMGELAEHNCFKMHSLAMTARPPLIYWNDATVKIIHIIHEMRKAGTAVYLTIDAGPQVKIICLPDVINEVKHALQSVEGIKDILECKPGTGASIKSFEKVRP